MIKKVKFFRFQKEAVLLDSGLYILKSFIAVITAYVISHSNPILKLDIISVLFGLMLTLEPVNLTGIRNGLNQLYSTCLGAAATAVIIYILGINVLSIALSIAFTLYVCLKIDWRAVSPVAIFTSIYMTQYVQKTAQGDPSILLTFRLRIFALMSGIVIAIIFNYLFSRFYYKSMISKRIIFLLDGIVNNLKLTAQGIEKMNLDYIKKSQRNLPQNFNNIDWVFSLFNDIKREYTVKSKIVKLPLTDVEKLINIILAMRSISHLNYDINYVYGELDSNLFNKQSVNSTILSELNCAVEEIEKAIKLFSDIESVCTLDIIEDIALDKDELENDNESCVRIKQDIRNMRNVICRIHREASDLSSF